MNKQCLPLWGKWIEMPADRRNVRYLQRVFPCGGSGLKYHQRRRKGKGRGVFPCGGSGLKFQAVGFGSRRGSCLPLWGKWIEISVSCLRKQLSTVSSPVGEVD